MSKAHTSTPSKHDVQAPEQPSIERVAVYRIAYPPGKEQAMLSNQEKETIVCFNETNEPAEVYTFNPRLIKQFERLIQERPDDVRIKRSHNDGAVEYYFPKKWVKVSPPRILSDEARAILSERAKRTGLGKTSFQN